MAGLLILYAGMTVLAAFLARWTACPSLFRAPEGPAALWGSLAAAVVVALAVVGGGRLLEERPWYRRMAGTLKRMLQVVLGPRLDGQKAFVVAVYSGIGEEALFRGWLQPYLIGVIGGATGSPDSVGATALGILAASAVFGVVHYPAEAELKPWTIFASLVGIAFGILAAWSGSLLAPVLAHTLINWLNLKRIFEIPLGEAEDGAPDGPGSPSA